MADDTAAAYEDEELIALRAENADLKHKMQIIGDDTEKVLRRRNHSKKEKAKIREPNRFDEIHKGQSYELRAAIKHNEELRREKLKLTAEMTHGDTARRISEMRNQITVVDLHIAQLQSDIFGLENVGKAQKDVVEMAQHAEQELRLFRSEHRTELNGFKEEMLAIQNEMKGVEKQLVVARAKMHTINEKLKTGFTGQEVENLRQKTENQAREIDELRTKEDEMMSTVIEDQRKESHEISALAKERQQLRDHVEALKATLKERERELKLSYALTTKASIARATAA